MEFRGTSWSAGRGILPAVGLVLLALSPACEQVPEDEKLTGSTAAEDAGGDPPAPDIACDPGAQTCSSGFKCAAFLVEGGSVRYRCVEDVTVHDLYDPCDVPGLVVNDGCPRGASCLPATPDLDSGICMPLCLDQEDCGAQERCVETFDVGVPYCAPPCSPFTAVCPAAPLACLETDDRFNCRLESNAFKSGLLDPCGPTTTSVCDEGLVCVTANVLQGCTQAACCTELCNLEGDGSECSGPVECTPLQSLTIPNLGACYIPF